VVAISSIGLGFLLFFLAFVLVVSARTLGITTFWASVGLVGLGSVLALPGMALGRASLADKGRSNGAGVAGCWINGLILGCWLFLVAARFFYGGNILKWW
jgi:hypothetical protein